MMNSRFMKQDLYEHLVFLYGDEKATAIEPEVQTLLAAFEQHNKTPSLTEKDVILITYADMVQQAGESPLKTMGHFLRHHLRDVVSTVHLLPFYPYSSDDGFAVMDYYAVDPRLGSWTDITEIGHDFRLMVDAVINHISAQSDWFQRFLRGERPYRDYFIAVDETIDLSAVFRPRTYPLLTRVKTDTGPKHVWTTFSADQVDLNYANPDVLLAVIDVLLFYVAQGVEFIRLDAIAFMWKEIGTSCIHLPQTHHIIQLLRAVLDQVAPNVMLITETNVPHEDNIAYFGNGRNEAQMVYNFSLPPLVLHAFHNGSAEVLSRWAATLTLPSDAVTFFNFLASHDGIGVTPAHGILSDTAVAAMVARVQQLGGHISYKNNPDGSQSAYELNINYLDALGDPQQPDESIEVVAQRFLAAQAIMLVLRGVPGIYFHSLFGSRGWLEGVQQSQQKRTINRQKLSYAAVTTELNNSHSLRKRVFQGYRTLLQTRSASPAFHPQGEQEILMLHPALFALWRTSIGGTEAVLCLHNVSNTAVSISLPAGQFTDLLTKRPYTGNIRLQIRPYQVLWLQRS